MSPHHPTRPLVVYRRVEVGENDIGPPTDPDRLLVRPVSLGRSFTPSITGSKTDCGPGGVLRVTSSWTPNSFPLGYTDHSLLPDLLLGPRRFRFRTRKGFTPFVPLSFLPIPKGSVQHYICLVSLSKEPKDSTGYNLIKVKSKSVGLIILRLPKPP